jgi:ribonuclease E
VYDRVEDEPRSRGGFGAGIGRAPEPEPFDPDLPPSRTQRARIQPPTRPVETEDDFVPRSRTTPPPYAPPPVARDFEPIAEPEAPAPREPREPRGRGRGRGRGKPVLEPEARLEPDPEPLELEIPREPLVDDAPRRRGGRDAIRSRGAERDPERSHHPAPPPAPPERPRSFGSDLEPERPRALEPERPRALEPERTRPEPEVRERPRPPERGRGAERTPERGLDRSAEPEAPRERSRPADPESIRERTRAHDRAGEEGYVPRRLRSGPGDPPPAELAGFPWAEPVDDLAGADLEGEGDGEPGEFDPDSPKGDGQRRRRRRRGRRRDREPVDRAPAATPVEADDDELEPHLDPEDAEIHPTAEAEEIPLTSDFDFGDDPDDHDFDEDEDEDDDELAPSSRVSDPEDRIDPELEEEIRKEIEEIAELEREMGLRGTVEARPRRGEPAGPEADGGRGGKLSRSRGGIKPPIQEIFRRGDEVLVQVIKESLGTKGPTLSTYISIPGRYLVLMPGLNRVGVSRKIADEGQRRKLREIMNELNPPKGLGFIVRTAGLDRTKRELARDLAYLLRLWKVILRRIKKARTPAPIYQESDMITRTIRDIFNAEIDTIWIDEPAAFERAQEFLRVVMPRFVDRLKLYDEKVPLFHKYGIEDEIAKIQRRRVDLPEGGSIVIDQTEALVAIDVNSGNFRVENDAEKTAYEMNLRAAREIARQLRLRDLGGVIVNDFIDMRDERNRRGVEKALRDAIKRDRARTKVLRMSAFGLIEMTRQRIRPSLKRSVYEDCANCGGAGVAKTVESMSIDVMRILALAAHRDDIRRIHVGVCPAVAAHLNNRKRKEIARIEQDANMTIHIRHEEDAPAEHLHIDCFDANNSEVRLFPPPPAERHHRHRHH